jgi:response regulator of citrate/malate metabolism
MDVIVVTAAREANTVKGAVRGGAVQYLMKPFTQADLPKGLSPQTLQLVLTALSEAEGDLSAAETAEAVGISRVSARRYLEHLVNAGRAEVRLRYGEVGRPERRYRAGPTRR